LKTKVKEELRKAKCEGMLNIQPLIIRSLSHSSSSSECTKGKAYNEKIQFLQMIIHDLHMTGIVAVEFLRKSRRH
jgi:hypothetical protein